MKVVAHQVEDFAEERIAEGVKDLISLLAANDNLLGAQHAQMLRNIGLFQFQPLVNAADGHRFLVAEQLDDGDPRGMRQGLKLSLIHISEPTRLR